MKTSKNLEMLALVARGLRDLKDRVVFVGGATVDLYITNLAGGPLRTTDDVDCVIGITSRVAYNELEEKLRALGFTHPMDDPKAPICRWKFSEILVDISRDTAQQTKFRPRRWDKGEADAPACRQVCSQRNGISNPLVSRRGGRKIALSNLLPRFLRPPQ